MLKETLKEFNLKESQIDKLNKLREIVLEYNKHTNLTSITDVEDFNIKHILDSLSILKFHNLNNKKILDVGSGGGFPGLALAIVLEDSEITMLDSNVKKIDFINEAIKELELKNANTIYSRVEEAKISEAYDIVVSRAVASMNILLEITSFACKREGKLIFYKGSNLEIELPQAWNKVNEILGIELESIDTFILDKNTERKIISFIKTNITNKNYPRIYSQIKKTPIY